MDAWDVEALIDGVLNRDYQPNDLPAALADEDHAEDWGMSPNDRRTCHTHRSWLKDCRNRPLHRMA